MDNDAKKEEVDFSIEKFLGIIDILVEKGILRRETAEAVKTDVKGGKEQQPAPEPDKPDEGDETKEAERLFGLSFVPEHAR